MGKVLGRNFVILFFGKYPKMARKFSKTAITQLQWLMKTNPFRIFLVLLSPDYRQNMSSKAFNQLVGFPKQKTDTFRIWLSCIFWNTTTYRHTSYLTDTTPYTILILSDKLVNFFELLKNWFSNFFINKFVPSHDSTMHLLNTIIDAT